MQSRPNMLSNSELFTLNNFQPLLHYKSLYIIILAYDSWNFELGIKKILLWGYSIVNGLNGGCLVGRIVWMMVGVWMFSEI